jgi:hypothetical protein
MLMTLIELQSGSQRSPDGVQRNPGGSWLHPPGFHCVSSGLPADRLSSERDGVCYFQLAAGFFQADQFHEFGGRQAHLPVEDPGEMARAHVHAPGQGFDTQVFARMADDPVLQFPEIPAGAGTLDQTIAELRLPAGPPTDEGRPVRHTRDLGNGYGRGWGGMPVVLNSCRMSPVCSRFGRMNYRFRSA